MRTSLSTLLLLVSALPQASYAQSGDIYGLAGGILALINNFVIPFLLSLAVLFFIYQILRYFILESDNIAGRQQARSFAYYGLLALVFIIAFWGIIAFVIRGFGFATEQTCYPAPDFFFSDGVICTNAPTIQPQPEAPSESPSVDIPPSIPAGDGTNGDTTPTLPGGLQPPSSGDDQPNTGNDVPDYTQTASIMQQRQALAEAANELIANRFDNLFGNNSEAVAAELLRPLTDTSGSYNDLDRLQAAYRLQRMGQIETQQLQDYYEAINTNRSLSGLEPITPTQVQADIQRPLPPTVTENQAAVAAQVRAGLEAYNTQGTVTPLSDGQIDQLVTSVTTPNISYQERAERFDALLGDNDNGTVFLRDPNTPSQGYYDLETPYIDNMNAEKIFNGDFDQL